MNTKTDMTKFKDALDGQKQLDDLIAETSDDQDILNGCDMFYATHDDTIRLALRIADKVMQEPSEGMCKAAQAIDFVDDACPDTKAEFRAMIEQMMREIGDIA